MEKTELLACPHCGGEAALEDWKVGYESGTAVLCVGCGACVSESVLDGDGWHERAVEKWNRRTPSPGNKPLTLEELREMDGEPVYIRRLEDADGLWIVVRSSERRKLTTDYGGYFEFNDYGKTWLAYRRPPEKGE